MDDHPRAPLRRAHLLWLSLAVAAPALLWLLGSRPMTEPARPSGAGAAGTAPHTASPPVTLADGPGSGTRTIQRIDDPVVVSRVGDLRVRTRDATTHQPIPAVGLTIEAEDGRAVALSYRTGVTDERGEVLVGGLPASRVHVRTDRGVVGDALVAPEALATLDIAIPPGVDVEGQVVDAGGGPLPFASIVVKSIRGGRIGHVVSQADAHGRFALRALTARTVFVGAVHAGHFPSTMEPVAAQHDGAPMQVVLAMRGPGAAVLGTVVGDDGAPVAGAVVRIGGTYGELEIRLTRDRFVGGWAPVVCTTAADGTFAADGLATGDVELLVHAPGRAPRSTIVALTPGPTNTVELRLGTGATLGGQVVDEEGTPLPGVRVVARAFDPWQDVEAVTSRDGRFVLDGCEPSRIHLVARKPGYQETSVTVDGPARGLAVVMRAERVVRGHLVDPAGAPLAGWSVRHGGPRAGRTDERGRFEVVEARGAFEVMPPGGRVGIAPQVARDDGGTVLRVPSAAMPSAFVVGRLIDAEGNARTGCALVLQHRGEHAGNAEPHSSTGGFSFGPLVPAAYDLKVIGRDDSQPPHWLAPIELQPNERLDLGAVRPDPERAPGRVRVVATRTDGAAVEHARGDIVDVASGRTVTTLLLAATDGREQALLPGEYSLAFLATNAPWTVRPFEIRSGAETVVELVLEPAVRRSVFFPWPRPDELPDAGDVQYSIRDASGVVTTAGVVDAGELPRRYLPSLAAGVHVLELLGPDGQRFEGSFRVGSTAPSTAPIVVAVSPVR